jgi:hypothetical protein
VEAALLPLYFWRGNSHKNKEKTSFIMVAFHVP